MTIKSVGAVGGVDIASFSDVPQISIEQVEAVCGRSKTAGKLCHRLQSDVDGGRVMSKADVESMLKKAHYKDGKPNPNQAVVLAYYAQRHGHVFGAHGRPLVERFLARIEWKTLMLELANFMEKLREEAREADKKRELEKERFEDDVLRPEERRAELKKDNGTVEDRKAERVRAETQKAEQKDAIKEASIAAIDDELTGSGQLQLDEATLAKLAMLKRGFANRG